MGLLDWLTDAIGGTGSSGTPAMPGPGAMVGQVDPMGSATGQMLPMPPAAPASTRPMPPVQPTGDDRPYPMNPPDGANIPMPPDMRAPPMAPPDGGDLPQPGRMPIPMPQPRPAAANGAPPQVPPGMSQPPIPGAPMNIMPPAQQQPAGPEQTWFSRALGITPQDAGARGQEMARGLAAGLKSVGDNAHKPGLAAFAGSMGSAMEGGQSSGDKEYDKKIKYLQAAVAAQKAGDDREYKRNMTDYMAGKLKNETDKMTADASGKKGGAWNKPDSQRFIDAQHALANDPEIKASQKLLEQTAKTGEPADVAKAQAQHQALIRDKEARYLAGVGLDARKVQDLVKNPPGSQGNPHVVTSQQDFDQYVKPGDAFVNPKDGKVYIRKGGGAEGGGESKGGAASAPKSTLPEPPGVPGSKMPAPTEDED